MHLIRTKISQSLENVSQFPVKHQEKLFMHKYSAHVLIRKDYIRKDGTSAIYLRVRINGKDLHPIPLNIHVKRSEFNEAKECVVLHRGEVDKEVNYNTVINNAKSKANEIFKRARLEDLVLTEETFERKYFNAEAYRDFIVYMHQQIEQRKLSNLISNGTYKIETRAYQYLKEVQAAIPFNQLTNELAKKYTAHLAREKMLHQNSIRNLQKKVSFYINQAIADGIDIKNPFKNKLIAQVISERAFLTENELNEWISLLDHPLITGRHREVLEASIFSAINGGFRISDLKYLGCDNLIDDTIVFTPFKTKAKKPIPVKIDLTAPGKAILSNRRKNKIFFDLPTDQQVNYMLKDIRGYTGITKKVTTHTFRHTFATMYITKGGPVNHLAMIMGIEQKTAMIYVHSDTEAARKSVAILNQFNITIK